MAEIQHEGGEKKSSKKKLIIIILAVVVLLAGGGGAAYFFLMKGDPAPEGEHGQSAKATDKHEAKPEENNEASEHDAAPVEKLYFDLTKPLVVNLPKGMGAKFVMIAVTLLVEGADTVDALKKNEPMVRNNLLMVISAQNADELKTREGKDKLRAAIKESVSAVLTKMAGKSRLKDVYFTSFVMQ
jgi:flagellar FliL protein